jgi:quercetin dioxygenase-like cupin family protein
MFKNGKNIKDLISYSEGGIVSKEIFKTEKMSATLFSMSKGTIISEHTSTKQGFIYVIEGDGFFNLEGNRLKMVSGASIQMAENAVHFLSAKENTSFLLVLFG